MIDDAGRWIGTAIVFASALLFITGAHGAGVEGFAANADGFAVAAQSDAVADRGGVSPGAALAIGAAATIVPLTIAAYGGGNSATWVGGITGIIAGPAVGLLSGGRGDLALRGVLIRTGGLALGTLAAATFGASFETDIGGEGIAVIIVGALGLAATAVSVVWDLAITPSATRKVREGRMSFDVRPDGLVAVTIRF